jgi:hypothetical protein
MTSAEAQEWAAKATHNSDYSALTRAADALAAWEAEDAARRAMPSLGWQWGVMDAQGDVALKPTRGRALLQAKIDNQEYPEDAPHRAVRLAVVEVVEPEPPKPVREVGPSGWEYEVEGKAVRVYEASEPGNLYRFSDHPRIPPADRALVARLLGEVP